jgi:hypothetical protein
MRQGIKAVIAVADQEKREFKRMASSKRGEGI